MHSTNELFEAAKNFDIQTIEHLVKDQGVDINAFNEDGKTAFTIVVESYYNEISDGFDSKSPLWDDESEIHFLPETNIPFEDRSRNIIPLLRSLIDMGADIDAAKVIENIRTTAFIHAIDEGDIYLLRFLLRHGADPNQENYLPVDVNDPLTYALMRIEDYQSPLFCVYWDEFKRAKDMEKLYFDFGGKVYVEEYYKLPAEEQRQPECEFSYELPGGRWALMSIKINGKEFSTRLGRFGHDIRNILYALYLVSPCERLNEDGERTNFIRGRYNLKDGWVILDIDPEGTDYTLSFTEDDDSLQVRVMKYEEELFLEECSLGKFVYAVVKACDEMLKKQGLVGYSKTFCPERGEFDISTFLVLKEWVMCVRGYSCDWDSEKSIYITDYEKELAILSMVM